LTIFLALFVTACQPDIVGGDRDENGCLTSAGYSYDADVGACTRNWEIDENEKEVIQTVLMVQSYSSFSVVSVESVEDCDDCYDVTLQRNPLEGNEEYSEPYVVPYREGRIDYSYDNPVTNFEECIAAGNPAMESYPRRCRDPISDKTYIEDIKGGWKLDTIQLMQHETEGWYGCYGCGQSAEGSPALCIDPIVQMKQVEESEERFCNKDFEVVEINKEVAVCGNNLCEEGEADIEGGCGEEADPRCLGPPSYSGTCPKDCAFKKCSLNLINSDGCDDVLEPVCGKFTLNSGQTKYQTFSNDCEACTSMKVDSYSEGKCEDQLFVVCDDGAKMFDPEDYARDNNGMCVEQCPDGFDAFMTQIGIQLCIPHYGESEIEQWETCDESSNTCTCARAYETTDEKPIADAEYRCVPDEYAERLIFRGGLDSLDENGAQSVMIA
jgi:hypothetical protein